jgi:hypothetical protein
MKIVKVRGTILTSGHNSRAMIDLPENIKGKVAYVIKANFASYKKNVADTIIEQTLDNYEFAKLDDLDLMAKTNVVSCWGKNGGKIATDGRYIVIDYNAETEQHKIGYTALLAVAD